MKWLLSSDQQILLHLARFKFLTNHQLKTLGVLKSTNAVNKRKNLLKEGGLLNSNPYGMTPGKGKVEYIHYLLPKGKKFLMDSYQLESEDIRMPIGRAKLFFKDYFHRKYTIDFHIKLRKWAKSSHVELCFFDTYFDKIGNNRKNKNLKAKTKLDVGNSYLIADAIFGLNLLDGSREMYVLEVYRGNDTLNTFKKLKKHADAMGLGSLNLKYDFYQPYRVLCLFEKKSMMQALMKKILKADYFAYMHPHFLFRDMESLYSNNIAGNWSTVNGGSINMLPKNVLNELYTKLFARF